MKAIVNIATRGVDLEYSIKVENLVPHTHDERCKQFKNWELFQKSFKSKTIKCKHTIYFDSIDEWQSATLFDGRVIDFHYDYEERSAFDSKEEWASYLFQGYEYIEGQKGIYDNNEVTKVIITF